MRPQPRTPAPPPSRVEPLPPYPSRRGTGPIQSFLHAWNGLIHTVLHQRNMRIHLIAALLVGLVGSGIRLGLAEKVTLIFCVLMVFFAEMLNSALEQLVDLAIQQFDEKARLTKDAAAAGVLVLAIGTVVIFSAILVHNWETISTHWHQVIRQAVLGVPLAALVAGVIMDAEKPFWLEVVLLAGALSLWAVLLIRSESYVFSVLNLGLIVLSGAAALQRRISGT